MTKNKKGQIGVIGIVTLFVGIIFCLALLTPIFDTQSQMTTKQVVSDESNLLSSCYTGDLQVNESNSACNITLANAPTGWKLTEGQCALGSVVVTNSTGGLVLEEGTDYNLFAQTGVLQFLNTTDTTELAGNITLSDYNYCADGYNTDSGSRSVAALIGLFAVLALLGFVLDRMGIIDLGGIFGK